MTPSQWTKSFFVVSLVFRQAGRQAGRLLREFFASQWTSASCLCKIETSDLDSKRQCSSRRGGIMWLDIIMNCKKDKKNFWEKNSSSSKELRTKSPAGVITDNSTRRTTTGSTRRTQNLSQCNFSISTWFSSVRTTSDTNWGHHIPWWIGAWTYSARSHLKNEQLEETVLSSRAVTKL